MRRRRNVTLVIARLVVTLFVVFASLALLGERTTPFGRNVLAQDPTRSVNENKTFNYELTLCPGKSKTQKLQYPADFVRREITSDQVLQRGVRSIATASFRSDIGELTITAGPNDGNAAQVMTITVVLTFSEFALGARERQRDQGIFTTFTHTYKIKVTVLPKSDPRCSPPPKRTPTGKGQPILDSPDMIRMTEIKMCVGDTTTVTPGSEVKDRQIDGFNLQNSNPGVASAGFYVEKKGGQQTSAPIVLFIAALAEGQTDIKVSDRGFLSPNQYDEGVVPYDHVYRVTVKRCRVATGPGANKAPQEGVGKTPPPQGYVPFPGGRVTVVPLSPEGKKEERRAEEKREEKTTPPAGEMKTIRPGRQTTAGSIIGLVVAENSRPGERAVVSVVPDPERYESIPGLKVVRKEIPVPRETTATGSLMGIVVDTGDGRTQRADEPIEISIPRDASLISVTLRREDDSTLLARVDTPIETSPVPVSDEGLDPFESPALKPGEEKVRRSREEAYRGALRKATESGQAVEEARKKDVSEDDLAKLRRQDQRNKDQADEAAKNVPPERRRAIQKEESDAYKRAAEEAKRKAQEERNKIEPDRRKEKDETLIPFDRREAKGRADEAERKARVLDEEEKKNQERSDALEKEAEKTKVVSPTSYKMPPVARDVGVHVINGPFKGDAIKDNVMVDGRPHSATIIAKSTSSLFYRLKEGTPAGMHRVTLREGPEEINFQLCVLNLALSADQLNLLRGQSTRFRAVISGPEKLPASAWQNASVPSELVDVPSIQERAPGFRVPTSRESGSILFVIENKSRDTVTIGQEVVVLRLNEQDFRNGPYRYEGRITARKSGSFKIDGTVVAFLTPVAGGMSETPVDDVDSETDSPNPSVAAVPQAEAKKCEWVRYNLGKDTNVTSVKSDKPTVVEVKIANLAGSGGFEYHCLKDRGTALITYKYTDVNGANQEGKLRVFCNVP